VTLPHLSLRHKIPLRSAILVLLTALAVTAAIIGLEYEKLRQDTFERAEVMAHVLSENLVSPLRNDDLWRAYEIVQTPITHSGEAPDLVFLLDPDMLVYVASAPETLRMMRPLGMHSQEFARVAEAIQRHFSDHFSGNHAIRGENTAIPALRIIEKQHDYLALPVTADELLMGTLVMRFSRDLHWLRFVDIAQRAGLITLLVLVILLPISWLWSQRIAEPLVRLAQCMQHVGSEVEPTPDCKLDSLRNTTHDEIGALARQFQHMLHELEQKRAMERQMLVSERLAALGRLSAGIAHEINNPLGGMLNAITTWKRHSAPDPHSEKTLALIERGLLQIRDTVSALLVEARPGALNLDPIDIEDVRHLIQPNLMDKQIHLAWDNRLEHLLPLPATLIRQVLINLLLNAMHAVEPHGRIEVQVMQKQDHLRIHVANDGAYIQPERIPHLFEPFGLFQPTEGSTGHGLGLWMTYQIVSQLNGRIEVRSEPGWTEFTLSLPIHTD
jgi:signal transduction histidine kinase